MDYSNEQKIKYYIWKIVNLKSDLKKAQKRLKELRRDAVIVPPKGAKREKKKAG